MSNGLVFSFLSCYWRHTRNVLDVSQKRVSVTHRQRHGRRNRGGGGRGAISPQYFANPKKSRLQKQRHIDQCIEIWLKYVNSSVDIGNHRYSNEQNCILLKKSVIKKFWGAKAAQNFFAPPPPIPRSFLQPLTFRTL